MVTVQRRVQQVKGQAETGREKTSFTLDELRSIPAWILLGEPGAGKTRSFEREAAACNGISLRVAEFIYDDVDDNWKNKTLFLDGLDEIRARANPDNGILLKIRSRLKQLGNPSFRIACRAADWFGESDKTDILVASPDGKLPVFNLLPLTEKDVLEILQHNIHVSDPKGFVKQAKDHGIDSLVTNPHMLKLLTESWKENSWPDTRAAIFEIACQKQAEESNKTHRNHTRNGPTSVESILDAAGYLFAVMLFSDTSGIALYDACANNRYPALKSYDPPNIETSCVALQRMIFVASSSSEERIEPSHRSIAEFLAARWLGKQIDQHGLPIGRVLNLLLGFDQKTVSGLRGLYAWLALHSKEARQQLLEKDSITVVLYGDVKPMSLEDKKYLLKALKNEIENCALSIRELSWTELAITLYDEKLSKEFTQILASQLRDDATQMYVTFILSILKKAELSKDLIDQIKGIAADDSWSKSVRTKAASIWLRQKASDHEALDFLDRIRSGAFNDSDDELAGQILLDLYPRFIKPQILPHYLHRVCEPTTSGAYLQFWSYELPKIAPESHLAVLLDQLCDRIDLGLTDWQEYHLHCMVGALLKRAVGVYGDSITDERLYCWLFIGTDQYGQNRRDKEVQDYLRTWLSQRPDRYKGLLGFCFEQCADSNDPARCLFSKQPVLVGATPPEDIGLWHFQQMQHTKHEALIREHLKGAMNTILLQRGNQGLTFEMILDWVGNDLIKSQWLEPLIYWEIPASIKAQHQHKQEASEAKRARSSKLAKLIDDIRTGKANPALMHELANVWLGLYSDAGGAVPLERFKNYCENYQEVCDAAETGFRKCILRKDLPSIKEIVDLSLKQRYHFLRRPCLVGMDLRWQDDVDEISSFDEQTLKCLICFRLTEIIDNEPDWFIYLIAHKPKLVAEVFFEYARKTLAKGKNLINWIYELTHVPQFQHVALIAVPKLLNSFPLIIKSSQLKYLDCLLKAGLRYSMPEMSQLIEKKIALKSLDVSQKGYWLTTGMLLSPEKYEQTLWDFVGQSWKRTNSVAEFLRNQFGDLPLAYRLTVQSLAKLIELLTPHAELDWFKGGGILTPSMQLGDYVQSLISKLAGLVTEDSLKEIERLLNLSSLIKIKFYLENARHELQRRMREKNFTFPSLAGVTKILSNNSPANTADLTALVLSHLDDIAFKIQTSNSDLFRQFWNEKPSKSHKDEHSCRDALLEMLKNALQPLELDCQPESDYVGDKRADIRVSYKNKFEVPLEIKGEWHSELWTSMNDQLIEQYTKSKNTDGYGIYIVLWFGGRLQKPASDGGKKPTSPNELKDRLSAIIPIEMQTRIYVRVIDVSWRFK